MSSNKEVREAPRITHGGRRACFFIALVLLAIPLSARTQLPVFKLHIEKTAAYRLAFEDLPLEGLSVASGRLGLSVAGKSVPLWVEDRGDGLFGPGDWVEFVGHRLHGDASWTSEHTRFNVYFFDLDAASPLRMTPGAEAVETGSSFGLRTRQHLEEDLLLPRLDSRQNEEAEELWYWAKLAHNSKQPFSQELDLSDLEPAPQHGSNTIALSIRLRGWSKPRRKPDQEVTDHRIRVELNGTQLAQADWNGTEPYLLEIPSVPKESVVRGINRLELVVPKRPLDDSGEQLIDVILLNSIEIEYPRHNGLGSSQANFVTDGSPTASLLQLAAAESEAVVVYGSEGSRWVVGGHDGGSEAFALEPRVGEASFVASARTSLEPVPGIAADRPSRLVDAANQADYIMVAHGSLIEAITPLADFHRQRGLDVEVVDIEDVYDEFNHGVVHPRALRDFFRHAHAGWQRPAPRFVLLVGDASWDSRNSAAVDSNYADWTYRPGETLRFTKNKSTSYPTAPELNHRGLIPTWNHSTYEGHSASDNHFVAIAGDDFLPDMAIGRLPVVEPDEVTAIVDKTISYMTSPEIGAWRRRALLITNESKGFQRQSDRLSARIAGQGFLADKVYPASSETSNEHHSQRLIDLFDEGQLIVHFLGHGGRYIWRTGPPDFKKNHDLFTLDHLDQLQPNDRLPVVLSLTCYSAPFDHPSADSIGEKLLRLDDRGAVSVVAASWRNSPSPRWGEALFNELSAPGATIGEAVRRAKHEIRDRMFVETYNLLGDPAAPVSAPGARIELVMTEKDAGLLGLEGTVGLENFAGDLLVDMVGADGEILETTEYRLDGPVFSLDLEKPETEVHALRLYAWNSELGVDAAGGLTIAADPPQRPRKERVGPARRGPAERRGGAASTDPPPQPGRR